MSQYGTARTVVVVVFWGLGIMSIFCSAKDVGGGIDPSRPSRDFGRLVGVETELDNSDLPPAVLSCLVPPLLSSILAVVAALPTRSYWGGTLAAFARRKFSRFCRCSDEVPWNILMASAFINVPDAVMQWNSRWSMFLQRGSLGAPPR